MSKPRKPRRNPQPQPSVATEQQFMAAMEYATAHDATINELYSARADKSNQCFVLVDHDNRNNAVLIGTLTENDPDGVARYVATCRSQGIRPWILVLVPDAAVRTLVGIETTNLRAGMSCRPNVVPVVAVSLPAIQCFGFLPDVVEAGRSMPTPSIN